MTAPNLKDNLEARLWFFNLAALLATMLVGHAVGPALPPFLWLAAARPLTAVLLRMLPGTRMGLFRPYLTATALLCLLLSLAQSSAQNPPLPYQLAVALLFLLVDTALDALLAQRCPEQEWLGRMGQLVTVRMAGLLLGLALAAPVLNGMSWSRHADSAILLGLTLLLACVKEGSETEESLPLHARSDRQQSESPPYDSPKNPPYDSLKNSLRALLHPPALQSLGTLLAIALLAGGLSIGFYPVAMLSEALLSAWLSSPGLPLGLVAGCAVLAIVLERLPRQALRAIGYSAVILALAVCWLRPQDPGFLSALHLAMGLALLVAHRQSLAATADVDLCLRGTVPVIIWTGGLAMGEAMQDSPALPLSRALGVGILLWSLLATFRHWRSAKPQPDTILETEATMGRHGDRTFDFEAAPIVPPRRRSFWLSRLWHFLSIRFPVTLSLVVMGSLILAGGWQASDNRASWERKTRGAWIAMQTELFLTSLKLRTEEEMLASNRVPSDWPAFIAANFELDGRPMKDRDFWGTPLRFEVLPKEIRIVSAGADRKMDTRDDLERTAKRPDGVLEH